MKNKEAEALYKKYREGSCTPQERNLIERWYLRETDRRLEFNLDVDHEVVKDEMWAELMKRTLPQPRKTYRWFPYAAAAVLIAALSFGAWFYRSNPEEVLISESLAANDVGPGGNRATLTFSDGKIVELSSSKTALVVGTGKLSYSDGTSVQVVKDRSDVPVKTFTIHTPRGGTYQVVLADGTKVWLNAASSLHFPAVFDQAEVRKVRLEGEGYFEVAKVMLKGEKNRDRRQPFIVSTDKQEVEVLGTHFNISSYGEEPALKTTLLEGSVRVSATGSVGSAAGGNVLLAPGQQSVLSGSGIRVRGVDAQEAVAWKNGEFMFDNEPLELIMNKIGRWYDLKIQYEDPAIKEEAFNGGITRFSKVSKVLTMLERTGRVNFEIRANTIVVKK